MTEGIKSKSRVPDNNVLEGGSVFAGLMAFFSASCCVLPLVLINLGASTSLVSNLSPFLQYRSQLIGFTAFLLVLAFVVPIYRGQRISRRLWTFGGLAAALAVSAYYLPFYEGEIQKWMGL